MNPIEMFKSKFSESETIEVPEFSPIGRVDKSNLKLEFTVRKRKKRNQIFNFFWNWYKAD